MVKQKPVKKFHKSILAIHNLTKNNKNYLFLIIIAKNWNCQGSKLK